jgi:hypothetical protein
VEGWLARLYDAGVETRNSPLLGNSQPTSTAASKGLSEFSGPSARRRVLDRIEEKTDENGKPEKEDVVRERAELRRQDMERSRKRIPETHFEGRPQMPAHNTAYLGRSLFSDYLLPVELAGMLLLVATIGAIAIAQRRNPPASNLPAVPGTSPSQERTT